eukprot:EG_transcript_14663
MEVLRALFCWPFWLTRAAAHLALAPVRHTVRKASRPVVEGRQLAYGFWDVVQLAVAHYRQEAATGLTYNAAQLQRWTLKSVVAFLGITAACSVLAWTSFLLSVFLYWWLSPSHADIYLGVDLDYRQLRPSFTLPMQTVDRGTYGVVLQLSLPQTPQNEEQGMACLTFEAVTQPRVEVNVTKCIMVRYQSPLLRTLTTVYYAMPLIKGYRDLLEAQDVVMLPEWQLGAGDTSVVITLSNPRLQVTKCTLILQRQLSWLKRYMHSHPMSCISFMSWVLFVVKAAGTALLGVAGVVYTNVIAPRPEPPEPPDSDEVLPLTFHSPGGEPLADRDLPRPAPASFASSSSSSAPPARLAPDSRTDSPPLLRDRRTWATAPWEAPQAGRPPRRPPATAPLPGPAS